MRKPWTNKFEIGKSGIKICRENKFEINKL